MLNMKYQLEQVATKEAQFHKGPAVYFMLGYAAVYHHGLSQASCFGLFSAVSFFFTISHLLRDAGPKAEILSSKIR